MEVDLRLMRLQADLKFVYVRIQGYCSLFPINSIVQYQAYSKFETDISRNICKAT